MTAQQAFGEVVRSAQPESATRLLVVCEHASCRIPEAFGTMGLPDSALRSHIAWDPGAAELAQGVAAALNGALVAGCVSRLVYDCNRPPDAPSAMPERSETQDIPGNQALTKAQRAARIEGIYEPFQQALTDVIAAQPTLQLLVTVHSFTPVYQGRTRDVQIGVLHGADDRFARAMLAAPPRTPYTLRLNEPYSAADGVAHTLDVHGAGNGLLNVMIEVRNDLLETPEQQADMTALLAPWISGTLARLTQEAA